MKDLYNIIILFLLFVFIQTIESNNKKSKIIPKIHVNSTQTISLKQIKDEQFLYFSFDFNEFGKYTSTVANFIITSPQEYSYKRSNYLNAICEEFIYTNSTDVFYSDIIENEKNKYWTEAYYFTSPFRNKLKTIDYYIAIPNLNSNYNKKKLIIRIPISKKEGEVKIQNVKSLYRLLEDKSKTKNKNNEPIINKNKTKNNVNEIIVIKIKEKNQNNNNNNKTINMPNCNKDCMKQRQKKNRTNNYNRYENGIKHRNNYNKYNYHIKLYNIRFCLGVIFFLIWTCSVILYFLVNRRKRSSLVSFKVNDNNLSHYMNI